MNGESCDGKKKILRGQCTLRSEHLFCSIFWYISDRKPEIFNCENGYE